MFFYSAVLEPHICVISHGSHNGQRCQIPLKLNNVTGLTELMNINLSRLNVKLTIDKECGHAYIIVCVCRSENHHGFLTLYECHLCTRAFTSKEAFSHHHLTGETYSCCVCDLAFVASSDLNVHLKTHQVEPRDVGEVLHLEEECAEEEVVDYIYQEQVPDVTTEDLLHILEDEHCLNEVIIDSGEVTNTVENDHGYGKCYENSPVKPKWETINALSYSGSNFNPSSRSKNFSKLDYDDGASVFVHGGIASTLDGDDGASTPVDDGNTPTLPDERNTTKIGFGRNTAIQCNNIKSSRHGTKMSRLNVAANPLGLSTGVNRVGVGTNKTIDTNRLAVEARRLGLAGPQQEGVKLMRLPQRPRCTQVKPKHEMPHFSSANYEIVEPNDEVDMPHFKCVRCEQLFINKYVFVRHIEKGKCYVNSCDACPLRFTKNSDFYEHYLERHTDRAICHFCFRTFMYEKNVKEHMLRHLDQFRHRCDQCNKGFYTVREYRNHYKNRHMGIRHKCEYCERSFADEYYFKRHIASHTRNKNLDVGNSFAGLETQ